MIALKHGGMTDASNLALACFNCNRYMGSDIATIFEHHAVQTLGADVNVTATQPLVARARRSPAAGAFLDGVNVAALALMTVVAVQLAKAALVDVPTILIFLVGAVALIRFKLNTTWLVLGGAVAGLVTHGLH